MKIRTVALSAAAFVLALVGYLSFKPVPIEPVAWDAPTAPGYVGPHAVNSRLAGLKLIDLKGESGPEHLVVRSNDGVQKLYAAVESGKILRMNLDGSAQEVFTQLRGRTLGFDFDAAGNMIVANAERGLLSIAPDKSETALAEVVTFGGKQDAIRFADAVVVAPSGLIYFSDASTRFGPKQWGGVFEASVLDIIEQSATGRIIEYNPSTRAARVVAHGISFANGLALTGDARHVLVNETGQYRIWKIALDANELDVRTLATAQPTNPQAQIIMRNLPGYPDNLMRAPNAADGSARFWVGLAKPRGAAVDDMAQKPWLRKVTLRLPRFLWPIPPAYGHVFQINESGQVLQDLQDPGGAYPETTGVTQVGDVLFIQSLHAKALGTLVLKP